MHRHVLQRPFHNEYWTGAMESKSKPLARVPFYPAANDPAQGVLYCPKAGIYTLTVRIPVPKVHDGSRDIEPPSCLTYRGFPEFWSGREIKTPAVARMMNMCVPDTNLSMQEARRFIGGYHPPDIHGLDKSLVFKSRIKCVPRKKKHTTDTRRRMLAALAKRVYGTAQAALLPSDGIESLGYWEKSSVVGKTKGSLSYQPQPEHCPQTFTQGVFKTHQEWCTTQSSAPTFHWVPFYDSREQWILTPAEIETCLAKPIRLFGDSIMHQYRRSFDCLARGYAGLMDFQYRPVMFSGLALEFNPIFAPRDAQGYVADAELDWTFQYHIQQDNANEPTIEVWAVGAWVVPHIPVDDFARGIHRWFARAHAHRAFTGNKIFVTLLTSPSSQPIVPTDAGWQTADRVYIWNQLILQIALQYDMPVIDTFWPTVHRFDARADNCHYCECGPSLFTRR